jgi:hypothetical protein
MGQQDMLARLLRGNPDPSLPGYPVMQSSENRGFKPIPFQGEGFQRMAAVLRGDVEPTPGEQMGMNVVRGFTEGPATIRAFHGSPHRFERFDMSRIGTGEGAQAYGHGLYFAGNEDVAKGYRDALAGAGKIVTRAPNGGQRNMDSEKILASLEKKYGDELVSNPREHLRMVATGEQTLENAKRYWRGEATRSEFGRDAYMRLFRDAESLKNTGSMYEVNLNTTPDRLLDWDAPLSGQSPQVRAAIETVSPSTMRYMETIPGKAGDNGGFILSDIAEQIAGNRKAGAVEAASRLREAGIPGIQYLDAGSRAAGEGSRNYVMFDDKLIDILRRYGIAGTLGGGAAATSGTSE